MKRRLLGKKTLAIAKAGRGNLHAEELDQFS